MNKYFLTGTLVIIIFLFYNIFLAFTSLEGVPKSVAKNPPFPYLSDKPLTEDGYYMLTVAWNIAEGKGFSYNYGIKTTGVQPLATILYSVPAYLVQNTGGDKYDFARAIIILSALLQVLFAFLIYKISLAISKEPDNGIYFLVAVCVVLLNFKVLLNFANGLETGLYLTLLGLFFLYWLKNNSLQPKLSHVLGLGILSGLILLARLDSGIILFTFYLMMLITKRISVKQSVIIFIISFLIFLPWQIYVWEVTGNLLQSSVRSQTTIEIFNNFLYRTQYYLNAVIQQVTPFLYTGNTFLNLMLPLGLIYIVIIIVLFKKYYSIIYNEESLIIMRFILASLSIQVIIYFLFSNAAHFYYRYTAFITVLSFPVLTALFVYFLSKIKFTNIYALNALTIIIFLISAFLYFHNGKSPKSLAVRSEYVKNNFDREVRIGAFQTGVLGYFCENVINLDGKMDNSALKSFSNGGIEVYIDESKIDVLLEWKNILDHVVSKDYLVQNWTFYSENIGDGITICYV